MAQKSNRNRRRGNARPAARPEGAPASQDRYQKYLPEWMRGTNGAPPPRAPRPARPRRSRTPRPAGGYTPGKMAMGDFTP